VNGHLTVTGTDQGDTILLQVQGSQLNIIRNGVTEWCNLSDVTSIEIFCEDGEDWVNIGTGIMACTIWGGNGNDILRGGNAGDYIVGENGDDLLFGNMGPDTLFGELGYDTLGGGKGLDSVYGGFNADTLTGGLGSDMLSSGKGHDSLNGGDGNDTLLGGLGNDSFYGEAGNDMIYALNNLAGTVDGGLGFDSAEVDNLIDLLTSIETLL
jgi:Ca2+-binding RTX toxin-like protein